LLLYLLTDAAGDTHRYHSVSIQTQRWDNARGCDDIIIITPKFNVVI